jgi:hypothetical protein
MISYRPSALADAEGARVRGRDERGEAARQMIRA